MTLILTLFAIGLVLLAVEVIVPGGIIGGIGALFLLAGTIASFVEFGGAGGSIALVASILLSAATLLATLLVIRKTPLGRRAFLETSISAKSSDFEERTRSLVGKPAEAITRLSPGGLVRIDGQSYEAFCRSGQVAAGTPLEVVGTETFRLIVSPTTPS